MIKIYDYNKKGDLIDLSKGYEIPAKGNENTYRNIVKAANKIIKKKKEAL